MYIKAMPRSPAFRMILAAVVLIVMILLLALVLSAAQFSLSLWQQEKSYKKNHKKTSN